MNDSDRYVWLIANIPIIEIYSKRWIPGVDKPLLTYLQDCIDIEIKKEGMEWIEKQRELLNKF